MKRENFLISLGVSFGNSEGNYENGGFGIRLAVWAKGEVPA